MKLKYSVLAVALSLGIAACSGTGTSTIAEQPVVSAEVMQAESEKANKLFDEIFMEGVMRSPIYQTYMAIKKDYGKWDDISEAREAEDLQITKNNLEKVKTIDVSKLDPQTALSHQLMVQQLEDEIADYKWRYHNYPVNQMFGLHSMVPSLLINQHQIGSVSDAEAYISRLNGVPELLAELEKGLNKRADMGIIAPKFVYPYVISDSKNLVKGAPFDKGEDSTLYADIKRKVAKLEVSQEEKDRLIKQAEKALVKKFKPAYQSLVANLEALEQRADTKDGAWKFPDGEAFFNNALKNTTTTDLTANEIHEIGLSEVARIHGEMREIMKKVDFKGDLQAFFEFMRHDKQFFYDETAEGKKRYLDEYNQSTINELIEENDGPFKWALDRYKYADRYEESEQFYREKGEAFLSKLDSCLESGRFLMGNSPTFLDLAIFPFIRQFAHVDRNWFYQSSYSHLLRWLDHWLESELFQSIMKKYKKWDEEQDPIFFPG